MIKVNKTVINHDLKAMTKYGSLTGNNIYTQPFMSKYNQKDSDKMGLE